MVFECAPPGQLNSATPPPGSPPEPIGQHPCSIIPSIRAALGLAPLPCICPLSDGSRMCGCLGSKEEGMHCSSVLTSQQGEGESNNTQQWETITEYVHKMPDSNSSAGIAKMSRIGLRAARGDTERWPKVPADTEVVRTL